MRGAPPAAICRADRIRRAGAHDHHPPDASGSRLHAQARAALRLRRARGHARAAPATVRRPAPGPTVRRLGHRSRRDSGPQPVLPHLVAPRPPVGLRRPHRDRCPPRSRDRGAGRRRRRGTADLAVARRIRSSAAPARTPAGARTPLAGAAPQPARGDLRVHVPQRAHGRRSTTSGYGRHSTTRPTGRASSSSRAAPSMPTRRARSCRRPCPAYEPYCPYTEHPGPGAPWTAPDMKRARELVARSGTAGERIVVVAVDRKPEVGRYFAGCSTVLGLPRVVRVIPYDPPGTATTRSHDQTAACTNRDKRLDRRLRRSVHLRPAAFGCASAAAPHTANLSHFCDRCARRGRRRALGRHGAEARARWTAIDRRLTDLAPVIPLANRRSVDFVSDRVGNVQHHLQWSTLLDQLWVR